MNQETKKAIESNAERSPLDDQIKNHLDRLQAFAIANPCIYIEDVEEMMMKGKNQIIFDLGTSKVWGVVITACIFADYESEYGFSWQVTTGVGAMQAATDPQNRKLKSLKYVAKDDINQLIFALSQVLELVADRGFEPSSRYRQARLYSISCPVSFAEFARLWRLLTEEQEAAFMNEHNSPERVRARLLKSSKQSFAAAVSPAAPEARTRKKKRRSKKKSRFNRLQT